MQNVPRLIQKYKPSSYSLFIKINRPERTFEGSVSIHGEIIDENIKSITLHSKDLDILSVNVNGRDAEFTFGEYDALEIISDEFKSGPQSIAITYNGKITDQMHGMYPCYYDVNGESKEIIATQFESHYAREVFPCIDEPEAKATFDVTLSTETGQIILGNMPIKEQYVENNRQITTFDTTPIMSSYLLAWVVGEFHKKTAHTKSGVEVNVWATPAQPAEDLDFALDIAKRSIEFYDEYFGIPYPLKKCDNVALPDFAAGAMENWGLITYREAAMLVSPKTTSIALKQYIATVIAHELSHQWFGNLVTMRWWNNLWLNESFANLMEYVAIDALEPNWKIWMNFISHDGTHALKRDFIDGVQPVQVDINHPSEISTIFDGAIVYNKGARLLQMLKHYIGDDTFRNGIKNYFENHQYSNTDENDLWKELDEASGKDIASFMNKWISQSGFPVLNIEHREGRMIFTQEKLSSDHNDHSGILWPIPINANREGFPEIFDTDEIDMEYFSDDVLFNDGNFAHYVVNYKSKSMVDNIIAKIKNGELSVEDRLKFLLDQQLLSNAQKISHSELIPTLLAYENEDQTPVWTIIGSVVSELKKFVDHGEESERELKRFAKRLAEKQYDRLGWMPVENESTADTKLRAIIISLMIYSEDPEVLSNTINIFESIPLEEITPELRDLIISAVIRHTDDQATFDSLLKTYDTTNSAELQTDICFGVTSTKNIEKINYLLDKIKDTKFVKPQDSIRWFVYLIRNIKGREAAWQWARDNWNWIKSVFSGDKSYKDFPEYIGEILNTDKQLQQYIDFFRPLSSDPALSRTIEIGINSISTRIDCIDRDRDAVIRELNNL